MFYLKYRPQTIKELDSTAVRERIEKILSSEHIPHAFLFTGPKGTGKTSTARIIAKVLNAYVNKNGVTTLEPKTDDENVKAITKDMSPDVIEIDAASHRKIDNIREIISQLKFAPITSRYKIYIIDEVHMLTKEAFNALLKSLEEPPSSTIFILATTEADALPKTITSRCVVIPFSEAQEADIVSMLQRISKNEKLKVGDDVLSFIAHFAGGSFRDAAKTLELASYDGDLSLENVKKIVGHTTNHEDLLHLIEEKKLADALRWCEKHRENGSDFKILITALLDELHKQLLIKNQIDITVKNEYNFSIKNIAKLITLLQQAYAQLKYSPISSLPLELALIDFIEQ